MTVCRRGPARPWRAAFLGVLLALGVPATARAQVAECDRSDDREVRGLSFEGNHAFTSRDLALRVATTPSDWTRRVFHIFGTRHCLDSDVLRLDVGRLRAFYRRHGYYAAAVDTSVVAEEDGAVRVAFRIREGEPIRIDTLRISGLDSVTRPIAAPERLELRQGGVFDITLIQAAVDSMKARLRNNGYPRADVAASYNPDTLTRRATVGLTVIPEARAAIGPIHIVNEPLPGQSARLGEPTLRRLIPLRTGDRYSAQEISDAQRTLYTSALFRKVDIRLAPDSLQPAGDSLVALDVQLAEDYMRQIDTELGWAELDCFKDRTHYVDKNFLGGARRLDLTAQVSKVGFGRPGRFADGALCSWKMQADTFSTKLNYYTGASVRFPTLFGLRTSPTVSVYSERRSEYKVYSRLTKLGGEASLVREIAPDLPLRLAYSLEYGRTEAQPAVICALFRRCTSRDQEFLQQDRPLGVVSARLDRVRVDNVFDPRDGTAMRFDVRGATRALGSSSDLQFLKGLADVAWYHALSGSVTLALRGRVGGVLGRTLSLTDTTGFIPPEERLYAGGATSVRGFQQNELGEVIYLLRDSVLVTRAGAADTTYLQVAPNQSPELAATMPVGGTSLVVLNVELRMRSPFYPELVQLTAFADGGDVWQRGVDPQARRASSLYLNALKWTPGIGTRINSAVGPIQVNVAYNPFASPPGALYFIPKPNPQGFAPLYCVSPGNDLAVVPRATGQSEQVTQPGQSCPTSFQPARTNTFINHLKLSFSIGPDF